MADVPVNRFGRRPGRGIRPWLLLPKILFVAIYVGGLAAVTFILFVGGVGRLDPADPQRLWLVERVGQLMRFLIVPALLLALGFGVALLLQHPGVFIRLRWLQVKLLILLIYIPASHFFLSSRLALLRDAGQRQVSDERAAGELKWGFLAAFLVGALVVAMGRLKPRLGQNVAQALAKKDERGG